MKINSKYSDIIFYTGLIILLTNNIAKYLTFINGVLSSNGLQLVGIYILIFSVLFNGFTVWDFLLIIYGFVSHSISNDINILVLLCLIIASKRRNLDTIIRIYVNYYAAVLAICTVSYFILLAGGSSLAVLANGSRRMRYSFFFSHPNSYSSTCMYVLMGYLYLNDKKLRLWQEETLILLLSVFIYLFPNSITNFAILIFLGICLFFRKYAKHLWRFLSKAGLPLLAFLTVVILALYYSGRSGALPSFLTQSTFDSRFTDATIALSRYQLTLFGTRLVEIGQTLYVNGRWGSFYMDMGIIHLLFGYGIVGFILFYYIFIKGFIYFVKRKQSVVIILLLTVFLHSVFEWTAFSVLITFPLLFLSKVLENEKGLSFKFYGRRERWIGSASMEHPETLEEPRHML